jgi:hypothetical protein
MREALVETVNSELYCDFGYEGDEIKAWVLSLKPWAVMETLASVLSPLLKLLRMEHAARLSHKAPWRRPLH